MQFFLPTKFQVFCIWGTVKHLNISIELHISSYCCHWSLIQYNANLFFFTGDLLIIMAQIIAAVQMVYEEKFVTRYSIPAMQAVGWEGNYR